MSLAKIADSVHDSMGVWCPYQQVTKMNESNRGDGGGSKFLPIVVSVLLQIVSVSVGAYVAITVAVARIDGELAYLRTAVEKHDATFNRVSDLLERTQERAVRMEERMIAALQRVAEIERRIAIEHDRRIAAEHEQRKGPK